MSLLEVEDKYADNGMAVDNNFDPSISPSKPLERPFRKIRKEKFPYYAPEGMKPSSYTAIIIQMLRIYSQHFIKAQNDNTASILWGKPVVPGRHHSKTIDLKKRGCCSIYLDSSEDDQGKMHVEIDCVSDFPKAAEDKSHHVRFISANDYDAETEDYDKNDFLNDDNDSDFEPCKTMQVKPIRKKNLVTKQKKTILTSVFEKENGETITKYTDDFNSKDEITDNQSTSKHSQCSNESNSRCSKQWLPGSQGSTDLMNSQGDIYSTQIQQRRSTKQEKSNSVKPSRKRRVKVKRKLTAQSSDDDDDDYFNDITKKRKIRVTKEASVVGEKFSTCMKYSSKTYSRKEHRQLAEHPCEPTNFDRLPAKPVLQYLPYSLQETEERVSPLSQMETADDAYELEDNPSPSKKPVFNQVVSSSEDEYDKTLKHLAGSPLQLYTNVNNTNIGNARDVVGKSGFTDESTEMTMSAPLINTISGMESVSREPTPSNSSDTQDPQLHLELVECPLCCQYFNTSVIERHAATCGEEDIPEAQENQRLDVGELMRHTRTRSTNIFR